MVFSIISTCGSLYFSLIQINQKSFSLYQKKPTLKMLKPFIRGNNLHHKEDADDQPWSSPASTPRKSSKNSHRRSHNKDMKSNPYSTRGLDKFSSLLADLEEKRHEIYSQNGSKDISLVRFVYSSNSNDVVPIVVKSKNKKQEKTKPEDIKEKPEDIKEKPVMDRFPVFESTTASTEQEVKPSSRNIMLDGLRRPSYYLPMVIVLILLFMAIFGRSGAILCVSLGWYMIPKLNIGESSSNVKKPMKKKEYGRLMSENKMVSDELISSLKSNTNSVAVKNKTPRHRGNSW